MSGLLMIATKYWLDDRAFQIWAEKQLCCQTQQAVRRSSCLVKVPGNYPSIEIR